MNFIDWGLIDYREATRRQLELVESVVSSRIEDTLVFCSHPPTVTLGRATGPDDLHGWQGEIVEVSRGGRATYHGPSQLVAYPIIDLSRPRRNFGARDLHGFMRALETAVAEALAKFGISAQGGSLVSKQGAAISSEKVAKDTHGHISRTGVWVANGDKKIASIGIACRKWVTYHGVALNVTYDPMAFSGINPCGMRSSIMTSIEEVLGESVDRNEVAQVLNQNLEAQLGF